MEEIEIKLLMTGFPKTIVPFYEADVNQFYLCVNPEIRMREMIDKYHEPYMFNFNAYETYLQTIKSCGDICRTEIEFDISKDIYYSSLSLISKTPIHKKYKKYRLPDSYVLEVSYVDNTFYYGEVEFQSIEDATNWVIPEELKRYVIKDTTYDSDYKMKNYWINTRIVTK